MTTYVHRDEAIRRYTSEVLRARAAYNAEMSCPACGTPTRRHDVRGVYCDDHQRKR